MKILDFKKLQSVVAHKSFFKIAALAVILLVVFKNLAHHIQETSSKQTIIPIVVQLPLSAYTPVLKVSGFTQPITSAVLKSNFKTIVASILVQKGREVSKDEVILELSSPEIEKRLVEATARYNHKLAEYEASKKLMQKSFKSGNNHLQTKADLEQARANLQAAETDAFELKVRALADGYLEECYVQVGNTICPHDKLVNLVYKDAVQVRSYVSEEIIGSLNIGMHALVKVCDHEFMAEISGLSTVADPQTRNFYVDLTIVKPEHRLAYGATADVTLLLPQRQGFWINASALTLDDDGMLGVKVLENSKVVFLPVKLTSMTAQGAYIENNTNTTNLDLISYGGEFFLPGQTPTVHLQKIPNL